MYDLNPQARPYAKAAFLAAAEEGQINEMFGDLKILSEACSDSSINKLIESPEEKISSCIHSKRFILQPTS